MQLISRRGALIATGTLAAAVPARKLLAQHAQTLAALKDTIPPAPPPPLIFTSADGTKKTLRDFAGKGVVLNLWATWCVPCVSEMPALDQLAGELDPKDIAVIALSSDRQGAPIVQQFFARHKIRHLDVWLDPQGDAVEVLKLRGIPTTLIIDRKGNEQGRIEGAVAWDDPNTVQILKKLVAGEA
jgi:thiol-disulfide isomerase/thioredoxin